MHCKIYFVGLASAFADCSTSWLASQYPELEEVNPLANPFLEVATVLGGQAIILHVGEKLKVDPRVTKGLALSLAILPFAVATKNLALAAIAHGKQYPWEECPLLYED